MIRKTLGLYLFTVLIMFPFTLSSAQESNRSTRAGIIIGTGSQQVFPFNCKDYTYNVSSIKGMFNLPISSKGHFSFEVQIEPGLFHATHQLINEFYVQPKEGDDYLEQRERFTKKKSITEAALNVGIVLRYNANSNFGFYIIGSVGPMISDNETERLAKGFAFSDIVAAGVTYRKGNTIFEIRPGVRHVSNANIQLPNSGHNSTNIDLGISFIL